MSLAEEMAVIRNFTRVYNKFTWVYKNRYLFSEDELGLALTGAEVTVLLELARMENTTAKDLQSILGMEQAYLSKILKKFQKEKLISRKRSSEDARYILIRLSAHGEQFVARLNSIADSWYLERLSYLSEKEIKCITRNMSLIIKLLDRQTDDLTKKYYSNRDGSSKL